MGKTNCLFCDEDEACQQEGWSCECSCHNEEKHSGRSSVVESLPSKQPVAGSIPAACSKIIDDLADEIWQNNVAQGFWQKPLEVGTRIALMHSELSEALEADRKGNPPDKHLPEFDSITVELADTIIRILDFAGGYDLPIGEALVKKLEFNKTRPHKHGKSF